MVPLTREDISTEIVTGPEIASAPSAGIWRSIGHDILNGVIFTAPIGTGVAGAHALESGTLNETLASLIGFAVSCVVIAGREIHRRRVPRGNNLQSGVVTESAKDIFTPQGIQYIEDFLPQKGYSVTVRRLDNRGRIG